MVMGLAIGSTSFVGAYDGVNKYAHDNESQSIGSKNKKAEDSLKAEYGKLRHHFNENHDVQAANTKLKALDKKMHKLVAVMKKDKSHPRLESRHEHSLEDTSKHLHTHIDKYARAHSAK